MQLIRPLPLFVIIAIATIFTACAPQKENSTMPLLAGTYTEGESEGIYRLNFDPEKGVLINEGLVVKTEQPSFLIAPADDDRVYAVNETGSFLGQPGGGISAFQWDEAGKNLTLLNQQNTRGAHPCFLSKNGNYLSVANYSGGNISLFQLDDNGELMNEPQLRQHQGSGPDSSRQEGPHAHCVSWRPDGKYLYAVDLGIDEVVAYSFDKTTGSLGEGQTAIKMKGGSGPRILTFHPSKRMAFLINELSCTVTSLSFAEDSAAFTLLHEESTLPEDFKGANTCAHIQLSPDGRFLYASNRGHDSIAAFSVSEGGMLKRVGIVPTQGEHPRYFTLSPDGQHLLVANRDSDNIVVFRINQENGIPEPTGIQAKVYSPVCLQFIR